MADQMQATPRSYIAALLSDAINNSVGYMKDPRRTQQLQGLGRLIESTQIPYVAENLSYDPSGRGLFTGGGGLGGTTRMRPEALEAAMTVAPMVGPTARLAGRGLMAAGKAGEQLAERSVPQIMDQGGMLAEILQGLAQGSRSQALPSAGRSGFGAFDPRYDPRVLEQARLQAMTRDVQLNPNAANAPTVSLADFEGRPFITSMSDRTAAGGNLVGIDNVQFNRPVGLLGGQDYMFNNPGQVWASGKGPAKALMKYANEVKSATGQDPIYLPYRMAPTGGDFAQMTGETMLAYADASMGKTQKKNFDKAIKKFIPDWVGVSDPASVAQFRAAPDTRRKAIKKMMDRDFRDEGGLNIGGARLAVSDPAQLNARQGGIMNVGEIYAGKPIITESGHPAYPSGVPGRGIGTVNEDISIFEMLPDYTRSRGIADPRMPSDADMRSISMHPYAGVITDELLMRLGY
jgi:hypothetical protein